MSDTRLVDGRLFRPIGYSTMEESDGQVVMFAGPNLNELGYGFRVEQNANFVTLSVSEIREMIAALEEETEDVWEDIR